MTWNYRVVKVGDSLGLYEVYYNERGKPIMRTSRPEVVVQDYEGVEGLAKIIRMMARDLKKSKHDILDESAFIPKS
jgi:hypothetical protein